MADALPSELAQALADIDQRMAQLHAGAHDVFALAAAWAEQHDALLGATPTPLLPLVRARLRRIGIRWGMVSGPRVTQQHPALGPPPRLRRR